MRPEKGLQSLAAEALTNEAVRRSLLGELDIIDSEENLIDFVKLLWPVLEPGRDLVLGWPMEAICDHLQAVTRGDITRLLINVPPGSMKSLLVRVFWPVWEWLQTPSFRYVGASYSQSLSMRDNRRARMLFMSDTYQSSWDLRMSADQSEKGRWENNHQGWMQATSVEGMGTGERGDRFIIDDPHNVRTTESEIKRDAVIQWFAETVPSRLNDLNESAIVVVMQRIHAGDVSGHILEHDLGYEHLMLPMEFESDRRCITSIGFSDPRTEEGELMWPERFDRHSVEELKRQFRAFGGTYAEAGQLQQRPTLREGGMFKVDKFRIVDWSEAEPVLTVRYWDKAGTDGGGAYTSGTLMSYMSDGSYLIRDIVRGQWSAGRREKMIRSVAQNKDGMDIPIVMEQEPGSSGKDVASISIANLSGFSAWSDRVSGKGSKVQRADPYSAQVEIGNVSLIRAEWNTEFIEEHRNFPRGNYADQVDSSSGAFMYLARKVRDRLGGIGLPSGDKQSNWARID